MPNSFKLSVNLNKCLVNINIKYSELIFHWTLKS